MSWILISPLQIFRKKGEPPSLSREGICFGMFGGEPHSSEEGAFVARHYTGRNSLFDVLNIDFA